MITLDDLKKFLQRANMGVYHKNDPLTRLEVQNDVPHYRINDVNLDSEYMQESVRNFNKEIDEK